MAIPFALFIGGCGSSDGGATGGSTGTTITAVDGYIKDATLKDASGQVATYSGTGGKYIFSSSPTYPIISTGGRYEDTNESFDINMSANSGTVISPITTFLENNSTILDKLVNLALDGNPATLSEFSVDYIDTNNTDLAKLAQLLYVVQIDTNLTNRLKNDMNVSSLSALYSHIESDINTTIADTTLAKNMRVFVQKVKDINNSVSPKEYETTLKNFKEVISIISFKGKTYGKVISPFTGKVWLDRNLGASGVCTALNDTGCYGDHYQWGRATDGHEKANSSLTSTQVADINATNANGSFIKGSLDWTTDDSNGSLRASEWSKTDGTSICPVGYRVPTIAELEAETILASTAVANNTDAFNNFLKLPSAGYRSNSDGSLYFQGGVGFLWSNSVTSSGSQRLYFSSGVVSSYGDSPAYGYSVRCLRD